MADAKIPLPPSGEIVTKQRLLQAQWANYRNANAFGGNVDPTSNWSSMIRNDSRALLLYRELEEKDDDIGASLDELKLSVAERNWTVTPGDDSQAALDASEFIRGQLENINFDEMLDCCLDAAPFGFSVGELMLDTSNGQASLMSVEDCPQEMFLFGNRFEPQIGPLQLLDSPYAMEGSLVPEEKFLIFSYRSRSRNRMGRPLLQKCFWPSWFKRQCLGLWLKCAEKNRGTAIARYASGAEPAEQQLAVSIADALIESNAIAVPEEFVYDMEMLKAGNVEKPDVYERLFEKMQYSIARAIKGETLTSFGNEGGKGSHAQGQTHSETFEKRSISLAKKFTRPFNNQLVRCLHLWNFGPAVAQPKFGFDIEEKKDLTAKATIFTSLQRMGVPMPQQFVMNEFGIPAVGDGDTALTPNVNAATDRYPSAAFSEREDARGAADANYVGLDALTAQLRDDAISLYATRVKEVTDALKPALKG